MKVLPTAPLDWHIHQWDVMINHIDSMNEHVSLFGVDLNLLHVFDALMTERSVTRAGKQVGLSQSATSNALSRLRALFGDALFVKTPAGMIPTPRAQAAIARACLCEDRARRYPQCSSGGSRYRAGVARRVRY
jgi:DNA-binding transcriptional LysR family regulator